MYDSIAKMEFGNSYLPVHVKYSFVSENAFFECEVSTCLRFVFFLK